jgi:hypothetical protein
MPTSLLLAAVVTLVLAGCGGESADKTGGKGGDVRVLRLANANHEPDELAANDITVRARFERDGDRLRFRDVMPRGFESAIFGYHSWEPRR